MTDKELEQFFKLIDEGDIEQLRGLREIARQKYNFQGFDHANLYNRLNFLNGTLHALEATRRDISILSAEKLIDILYRLGYAYKRIVFCLFEFGFLNFHYRDVMNYIHQNEYRLKKERRKFMEQLDKAADDVFQQMQNVVMQEEKETLELYLENIRELRESLKEISPVREPLKHTRIQNKIQSLLEVVKKMHGVEAMREAKIDIMKGTEMERRKRALNAGFHDEFLKQQALIENGVPQIKDAEAILIE